MSDETKPFAEIEPESAERIRADIEETRATMGETIDAIQEKLDLQHIKDGIAVKVHDATIGKVQDLAHVAGEKLAPASEKAEEVTEMFATWAKPVGKKLRGKVNALKSVAKEKPWIVGGAALLLFAVSSGLVFVSKRRV